MKIRTLRLCVTIATAFMLLFALSSPAWGDVVVSQDDDNVAAADQDAGFGLNGFDRMQTGSNRAIDNVYYGYTYSIGKGADAKDNLTLLCLSDKILVYIPADVAKKAGFDPSDSAKQSALIAMLTASDDLLSNGGVKLSSLSLPYVFTSESTYVDNGITYTFNTELKTDYYYAVVNAGSDESAARAASTFCDTAQFLPASEITVISGRTWLDDLADFFANLDWRPLWVSLKTAGVAMVFIFILGMIAAWQAMHVKSKWKSVLDSILTIPMVLPPTVCGFLLLLVFGKSTNLGQFLIDHGINLVFTWEAAVIAAVVVAFPLMYRTVLGAFESLDTNMLDAARTLGWSEGRIFVKLMMPLSWPSIAAGTVLAFARAMGEFGCTLFFAGNYAGITQTIPIAIYFTWMSGSTDVALFWVIVVILFSFLVILFINLWSKRTTKYMRRNESQ